MAHIFWTVLCAFAYTLADVRTIVMVIGHVHASLAVRVRTMTRRIRDETTTKP